MTKSPCDHYQSWTDHGLQITQCLEFWAGQCGESMSPHYKQDCPWKNGYPCAPRKDNPAPLLSPDELLARRVREKDQGVED
jgi:hypothetical protein